MRALLSLLIAVPLLSLAAPEIEPWRWSGVKRIVAIGDIHGAYPELTGLLQATGVVDESLRWIAGETHLVSLGDLLDRGAESRKVMDLLIRLQSEAQEHGGAVHVVAGNHEIMNLVGDLRYVSMEEYAAFSDLDSNEQRQTAYQNFLDRRGEAIALSFLGGAVDAAERNPKIRAKFEDLYPPGYFGHRDALSPEGAYGAWLLELPAMIVINGTVFVHGGLPPVTASAPIDVLNRNYHSDLSRFFELWGQLIDAGILTQDNIQANRSLAMRALHVADPSTCPPEERRACARERGLATDRQRSPSTETLAALVELLNLENSPMFGPRGPLWYRGTVRCKDILEMPVLEAALDNLGAHRVVVGHTPTRDRRVHQLRNDKLIMLDTGMLTSYYRGRPAALIIEETGSEQTDSAPDHLAVQYLNPTERVTMPGAGGTGPYPLSDAQLRDALGSGKIIEVDKGWFGASWTIELEYQNVALKARFFPANPQASDQRELAADQLDELLGFELVPITVPREIAGQPGALQLAYPNFVNESSRLRQGIEVSSDWCPLPVQQQLLSVYDLLIGNPNRSSTSFGYVRQLWGLQASEHEDAFTTEPRLPDTPALTNLELPGSVWDALRALDENNLQQALGQQLSRDQIAALLARRDAILNLTSDPAG